MKFMKIKNIVFTVLFSLVLISCSFDNKNSIDKLYSHVAKIEKEHTNYNQKEWDTANTEFDEIVANIEANYETMTQEERDAAVKAIGKYYGLVAKKELQNAAEETQKIFNALPSFIEGLRDAFK